MANSDTSATGTRWRDLRTGFVFVAGLALAGTLALLIGKNTGLLTKHDTAHIFLADIKGLTEGNMVTVSGKKVGTIASMHFESRNDTPGIRIDLDIRDEYFKLINEDAHAVVKSLGVLGDKYVDIQLGRSTRLLHDGGWLSAAHSPGMEELTSSALQTMGEFANITSRISRGEGTVGKLISSDDLATRLMNTAANLESISEKLRRGEGLAGRLFVDRTLADSVVSTLGDLHTIVSGLRQGQGTVGQLLVDTTLYFHMSRTVARSDSLLASLNSQNGSSGRFIHDSTMYVEFTRSLVALDSLLNDLKMNPERYLRFSVF